MPPAAACLLAAALSVAGAQDLPPQPEPPAAGAAPETNPPGEGELTRELLAQEEASAPGGVLVDDAAGWKLSLGADLRARIEAFDHLPSTSALGDNWSYTRFRTRVFLQADRGDFTFYTRLVNEWRTIKHGSNSYPFPDELIFDQLYLEFRNLFGAPLRLRAGRQDMMFGSLRVMGEGTPGDGSRSFSFNALRLTWTPVEKLNLDFFGIYNRWYDELSIGGLRRERIGAKGERDLNGNHSDEAGAGLYLTDKRADAFPYELYYIWKHETADARGMVAGGAGRDTHTLGARLLPKLTDSLSAEIELAGQLGRTEDHRDIAAFMLYGGLTHSFEARSGFTPYLTGAAVMLSGDTDEAGGDISAWNPVWGRIPAFGDLSGMVYPGMSFWYQNLIYPHIEAGVTGNGHSLRLQTGPMFAQHEYGSDIAPAAAGSSHYRGWHIFSQYAFPITRKQLGPLKSLTGRIEADCIFPGGYYEQDSVVYFLRFELSASF